MARVLRRARPARNTTLLSRVTEAEFPAGIPRARELTCIELRRAPQDKDDRQLRAAGAFGADLPRDVALTLSDAIRSSPFEVPAALIRASGWGPFCTAVTGMTLDGVACS